MRQYIFYSPELDCFTLMIIMEDCYISLEWDNFDMYNATYLLNLHPIEFENINLMQEFLWMPVGEL